MVELSKSTEPGTGEPGLRLVISPSMRTPFLNPREINGSVRVIALGWTEDGYGIRGLRGSLHSGTARESDDKQNGN